MKYTEAIISHLEQTNETGDALAERAGVSRATFYRILRGDNDPRISSIENLLKTAGYVLEAIPAAPSTPTEPEEVKHELA
ncbi:hypothetical protein [Bilophila wadsworthia]|uniref:helix-turn-helix domain-containing protein n=1 Tax=Bilophila wadsworthia TaxID=35833 RepID=UPI003260A80C